MRDLLQQRCCSSLLEDAIEHRGGGVASGWRGEVLVNLILIEEWLVPGADSIVIASVRTLLLLLQLNTTQPLLIASRFLKYVRTCDISAADSWFLATRSSFSCCANSSVIDFITDAKEVTVMYSSNTSRCGLLRNTSTTCLAVNSHH